jgi:uncharacterized phage-associated protein
VGQFENVICSAARTPLKCAEFMLDRFREWLYVWFWMEGNVVTDADAIALYFIDRAHKSGSFLTNLKLQKLLYYAQGWHLGLYGVPLFTDRIEAWVHGPVVPPLYRKYKNYGWNNIDGDVIAPTLNDPIAAFLEELCKVYFHRDAYELELMTHRETPWTDARKGLPPEANSEAEITQESMKAYFAKRATAK